MADLTPDEMSFFETGTLPASLEAEHTASLQATADAATAAEAQRVADEAAAAAAAAAATKEPDVKIDEPPSALERQLQEERASRAQLETSLAEIRAQLAERLKTPEPKVDVPDPTTDPLGHMMHQLKTVNESVAKLQTELTARQQADAQQANFNTFKAAVDSAKATFETTTPDFKEAYAHVRALRTEDLRLAGCPEADIPKILVQDELQIAQTALQRGKNPAEEVYAMAKRYGYVPKQAATVPVVKTKAEGDAKIEQLKAGVAASKQPGKGAPEAGITLTTAGLKDVSNSDLNKLVADDKMWNKIVGGHAPDDLFD